MGMRKTRLSIGVPALFLFAAVHLPALPPLPVEISDDLSIKLLRDGEFLVREHDSISDISVSSSAHKNFVSSFRRFADIDPNFLAEALFIYQVEKGTEHVFMEQIIKRLMDIKQFDTIPYYSKHNGTWNQLFEQTAILEKSTSNSNTTNILAHQMMRPFKPGTISYWYRYFPDIRSWLFLSENVDPLRYKFVSAVKPGNMVTLLYITEHQGEISFYGLGGAKAFDFFGFMGERLNMAFLGRIHAFFNWFYEYGVRG